MGCEDGNRHRYGATCRKEINLAAQQGLVLIVVAGAPLLRAEAIKKWRHMAEPGVMRPMHHIGTEERDGALKLYIRGN